MSALGQCLCDSDHGAEVRLFVGGERGGDANQHHVAFLKNVEVRGGGQSVCAGDVSEVRIPDVSDVAVPFVDPGDFFRVVVYAEHSKSRFCLKNRQRESHVS